MNRAKSVVKPICAMIVLQAVCLSFGLWLHGHFVFASSRWRAKEEGWAKLNENADEIRPRMLSLKAQDLVAANKPLDNFTAQIGTLEPSVAASLIVVDTDWKVLFSRGLSDQPSPTWQKGQTVRQERLSRLEYAPGAHKGVVHTTAGPRQAIGWLLTDGSGFALICANNATPKPTAAMIIDSLPTGAVVAFLWIVGLQSIGTYIVMVRWSETSRRKPITVDEDSLRRAQDLIRTRDAVIIGLAKLAEARDTDTGQHLDRIGLYCTSLASSLRRDPEYRHLVSPGFLRLIRVSSALHDIGKVGIEDAILLKRAQLTEAERVKMQHHTVLGGQCLGQIERQLGTSNFLDMGREIAFYHHECWDGSGYPFGLKGEEIPLAARIVAIADVYDALAFKRVYKDALAHEKCVDIVRRGAGERFDPKLVKVFLEIHPQFQEIARSYSMPRSPILQKSQSDIDIDTVKDLEEKVHAAP